MIWHLSRNKTMEEVIFHGEPLYLQWAQCVMVLLLWGVKGAALRPAFVCMLFFLWADLGECFQVGSWCFRRLCYLPSISLISPFKEWAVLLSSRSCPDAPLPPPVYNTSLAPWHRLRVSLLCCSKLFAFYSSWRMDTLHQRIHLAHVLIFKIWYVLHIHKCWEWLLCLNAMKFHKIIGVTSDLKVIGKVINQH